MEMPKVTGTGQKLLKESLSSDGAREKVRKGEGTTEFHTFPACSRQATFTRLG